MKNIFIKPSKEKLNSFVSFGSFFISIAFIDVLANTFLNLNFTKTCEEDFSSFFKKNAFHSNTLKIMESVKYDKDLYLKMMDLT